MTTQTVKTNFRTLFAMSDVLQEVKMVNSALKIQLCGTTKCIQLPCNKPVPLDFPGVQMSSKIEFDLEDAEGNVYGYSEFPVPDSAFKNRETQINQQIHFYLNNSHKEFIATKIFIILLNTDIMQRPKFKNSLPKTPSKTANCSTKSSNKSFSTPQKKMGSTPQKRQKTEDKDSYPSVESLTAQHDTRDFDVSVRENTDTFDQGDYSRIQNAVYSQASSESFLPSSLIQVSTPKHIPFCRNEQNNFSSKTDQLSLCNTMDNRISKDAQIQDHCYSEPALEISKEKNSGYKEKLINLAPFDNNMNSSFNAGDTINVSNSYAAPTESDAMIEHHLFQTLYPGSSNPRIMNRETKNLNENTPEIQPDKSIDDDTRLPSSSKKRKPATYSPISEKNATSRLSYSEIAYYKAQVEQLQNTLLIRDSEITIVNILKKENADLKVALQRSEESRKSMQIVSSETIIELKQVNQELQSQVTNVFQEKKDLISRNIALLNRIEELEKANKKLADNLISTENHNRGLTVEIKELRNNNGNLERTQQALENFEQKRNEERTQYMQALFKCKNGLEEAMVKVESLTKEKKELTEDLQKIQLALVQETNNSRALQDGLFLVEKKLQNAESYKLVIDSLESEKQELIQILFDKKKGQTELQNLLDDIRCQLGEKIKESEAKEECHNNEMNILKANLKIYEEKNGNLTNEITELRLRVSELTSEQSALGQLVCLNKDIEQQLEVTNQKLLQVISEKEKLSEKLLSFCHNQETASARLLQSEKANFEVRECLNERDEYIASLKKLVTELRETHSRYIPSKDDPIDIALAKYLNNKNDIDKLKFLFFRESCGVYQFGTKRVYIKLEGDRIIIRVGGGYSTIEDFLDQHLQFELEKLLKNGSVTISTRNIIASRGSHSRSSQSLERNKI